MAPLPRQQFAPVGATLRAMIRGASPSGRGGRERFEREVARRHGVPVAVAVNSGRAALLLLLRALGLPGETGVALAALNFVPLVDAIAMGGWRPVPVDVDPVTWTLSPDALHATLRADPGIRVVLATHLFGNPCDIIRIREVCEAHGAVLLEDCAHGALLQSDGRMLGTVGAGALLSLEASKPLSALAGGVALCASPDLADRVRSLAAGLPQEDGAFAAAVQFARFSALSVAMMPRVYGMVTGPLQRAAAAVGPAEPSAQGPSAGEARKTRMPLRLLGDIQAAIGLTALERIDEDNRLRRDVAAAYRTALSPEIERMSSRGDDPALLYFPIAVPDPRLVASRLLERGIGTRLGYMGDCSAGRCAVSARLSSHMLCLPVWPGLSAEAVRWVGHQVDACLAPTLPRHERHSPTGS